MTLFIHSAFRRFRPFFIAMTIVGALSLVWGCSSYHDLARKTAKFTKKTGRKISQLGDFTLVDDGMTNWSLIGPMENKTTFETRDFGERFRLQLAAYLQEKCSGITFTPREDPRYPSRLAALPRDASGRVDNFALAGIGRSLGLNSIVTGSIVDIREFAEERGFMWWRDTHKFLQVLVNLVAYDTATAAKLLDESYMYETELDLVAFDELASSEEDLVPEVETAITDAADFLGDELCAAAGRQPWTGFVTAVSGNRVELSSGSAAGLAVGQELDVFDWGTVIEGAQGQRFTKPGAKIGAVRVVEVLADRSVAERLSDQAIPEGSALRPR